jgi:predicted DNA-binding antitoxin AbrB/MazE fold protein
MVRQLEAIFEQGVLRPLEPLSLPENQRVLVTITDINQPEGTSARTAEQEWLKAHSPEYRGQWVALHGNVLLSHGAKARVVRDEARRKGIPRPLLVRVAAELDQPSAGWL